MKLTSKYSLRLILFPNQKLWICFLTKAFLYYSDNNKKTHMRTPNLLYLIKYILKCKKQKF